MSNFWTTKRKILVGLVVFLCVLNVVMFKQVFLFAGPRYLKVSVLDIGQGDSIFIETPAMRHIVIDGGPNTQVLGKLQRLLPFWNRNIDVVVLTHPDADHLQGLLHVLHKYKVGHIVWTGIVRDGEGYQQWINLVKKQQARGSKMVVGKLGLQIKSGGTVMEIIHPFDDLTGQFFGKHGNDTGIVSRLAYKKKSFLFTTDISSEIEANILDRQIAITSDVLKVPHHGSKYSSSEAFLQAVAPKLGIISSGKNNSYGHPTPETLQRLANFGITVLRTDRDGDVQMISDGKNIIVK